MSDIHSRALTLIAALFRDHSGVSWQFGSLLHWCERALTAEARLEANRVAVPRQPDCPRLACRRGHPVFFHAFSAPVAKSWGCEDCDEWLGEGDLTWVLATAPRVTGELARCT